MRLDTGPLRVRNFRLLFAARSISYFGTYLAPIAVAFAVLDLTGSASDTGIAFACWTLAQVSTLMVGGVIGAQFGARAGQKMSGERLRLLLGLLVLAVGIRFALDLVLPPQTLYSIRTLDVDT